MKFTATDLVRKASEVFNEVQRSGMASIVNRGRPAMVIMTNDEFSRQIARSYDFGFENGKKKGESHE